VTKDEINQLSLYICHKRVNAGKITELSFDTAATQWAITVESYRGVVTLPVTVEWMDKHKPVTGGYLVVYNDDYVSFSPAAPFEEGYTLAGAAV